MKEELEKVLKALKRSGKRIELQLYPSLGNTTISKKRENRVFINDGRDGSYEFISESEYDELVRKYDSRKF